MPARPVTEEPEVTLEQWGVMQDKYGYRLVGIHAVTRYGRVTSPLIAVNRTDMTAVTLSGRVYRLRGPEDHDEAAKLIHVHLRKWGLTVRDAALADFDEAVMALVSRPIGGLN